MKIARIETFASQHVCFVKVTAENGAFGWGQAAPYNADITASVIHRQVAPHALGRDIEDAAGIADTVILREYKFPGSYVSRAIGGVETALWDLRGRLAEKPVCALLGGTPGRLRTYASSMKRDITPKDEAERFRRLRGEYGYDAFKFRIGAECGRDVDEWPGRTEEIIPTIRKALGDGVDLLVDGNSGFSPTRAIEVGRILEDYGICHFEEPCPYWEYEQTKEVTDALSLDVAGGEQDCMLADWRRMISGRVVDIVQPDVLYLGGMGRTIEVAETAHRAGITCTPHAANQTLVTLFTMHLLRVIPNAGPYLEFNIEVEDYYPWQYGLFLNDPYTVQDGHVTVTDAPGWGVEIDPAWLSKAVHQVSEQDA